MAQPFYDRINMIFSLRELKNLKPRLSADCADYIDYSRSAGENLNT